MDVLKHGQPLSHFPIIRCCRTMGEKLTKWYVLHSDSEKSFHIDSEDTISKPSIPEDAKIIWSQENVTSAEARSALDTHLGRIPYSIVSKEFARLREEGAKPSEIVKNLNAKYGQLPMADLADHFADAYKISSVSAIRLLDSKISEDIFDSRILKLSATPE